jgi:hypothetical protein
MGPRLSCIAWVVALLVVDRNASLLVVDAKRILVATMPGGTSHLLEIMRVANHLSDMNHDVALLVEDWDIERAHRKLPPTMGDQGLTFLVVSPYDDIGSGRKNFEKQVEASQEESLPVSRQAIHKSNLVFIHRGHFLLVQISAPPFLF